MRLLATLLALLATTPVLARDSRECEPGRKRMPCIHRNGVCVDVEIDGHPTKAISHENRARVFGLPDMDEVCWQVDSPVSATLRVVARGGGLQPDFIGKLQSIGGILVPIDDYDPELDGNLIQPLRGFRLEADGYRDGTWQLRAERHFRTPGSSHLPAGEYVLILRIRGADNWDKQEVLVRIDPTLEPAPANLGSRARSPER